jgi:hypothetical protein
MRNRLAKTARAALLCGVAWIALGTSPARAGFTVTLDSTAPSGSNTVFNYSASVTDSDQVVAGNFFRIYDFGGLAPGTLTAPAGWAATVSKSDLYTPPSLILVHGDDPAIDNLTFTYKGTSPITGKTTVTGFSATTALGNGLATKDFVGQSSLLSGGVVSSIGDVSVPDPVLGQVLPVPEPSSVALTAVGVLALALHCSRRTRLRSAS